jgi:DNA-binding GntR family transcriptional regulator
MSGPSLGPPGRSSLTDTVYQMVRDSLTAGRIAPGTRLNLESLAREMHVSNTPVRHALERLESEGLVAKEPYHGFSASLLLDSRTIVELYDYRMVLEPPIAARAARIGTESEVRRLAVICNAREIRKLIEADATTDLSERDTDFHLGIAAIAGNRMIADHLATLLTKMKQFSIYHHYGVGDLAWREHRTIAAAMSAGDARAAGAAMSLHLTSGFERVKAAARWSAGTDFASRSSG